MSRQRRGLVSIQLGIDGLETGRDEPLGTAGDPSLADVLFDLAIKLEEPTQLPVDVEHILAAIVMAARQGELAPNTRLSSEDPALAAVLINHVKTVFAEYDGKVGRDD